MLLFSSLFLVFTKNAYAASLEISGLPSQIDFYQELDVDTFMQCSGCGDSYLRGVFYKSGTTKYFGFTRNNSGEWYELSGDKTFYFLIEKDELIESTWSGKLRVKSTTENDNYIGEGDYLFKIIRYTPSGSVSTYSNEVAIKITGYSPTPTPTDPPTSVPTSTPTPTPTPSPTPSPTPKPVVKAASTKSASLKDDDEESSEDAVIDLRDELNGEEAKEEDEEEEKGGIKIGSILLIIVGLGFIGLSGYTLYTQKQTKEEVENE